MNKNEALLIIDMGNDFVHDKGGLTVGKAAQSIVSFIIQKANEFLAKGKVVVFTMDAHQPNDSHFDLWPIHNVVGTWGQELYGELKEWFEKHKENPNVKYVPKTNYNAFHETNLNEILKEANVEKVYAVGVCTDICDFLTIAGADAYGYKTAIFKEGAATFTPNTEMILNHMKLCFHTEIV